MAGMRFIVVKNQFNGVHCYPKAPEPVKFLRDPHRHVFYVETEIEVFHDDRELEFLMVKKEIDTFLSKRFEINLGSTSCEMIAEEIQTYIKHKYPMDPSEKWNVIRRGMRAPADSRTVNVKVFEDNENGAILREV
jgi:hypothetical protein